MTRKPRKGLQLWIQVIGEAALTSSQALVCYALLNWADYTTGIAWPSNLSIAHASKLHEGTVRRVINELRDQGLVETIRATAGGFDPNGRPRTNHIRLRLDRLIELKANAKTGRTSTPRNEIKPRRRIRTALAQEGENPRAAHGKPSIHTNIPTEQTMQGVQELSGNQKEKKFKWAWMDAKTPEEALAQCGVRGPNLKKLANAERMTVAMIQFEAVNIWSDSGVRSKPAVLVKRLSGILDVQLRRHGSLSPMAQFGIAKLETLRRSKRQPPPQ